MIKSYKVNKLEFNSSLFKGKEHLLPKCDYYRIEIQFKEINSSLMNAIRRVITDELNTYIIDCPISSVESNVEVLFNDWLCDRLAVLPLKWDIDENIIGELNIRNDDDEPLTVTTKDLKFTLYNKVIPTINIVDTSYRLWILESGEYIKLKFTIDKRRGDENQGDSVIATILKYDTINKYMIFQTNGTINGNELLPLVYDQLIHRLNCVKQLINNKGDKKDKDNNKLNELNDNIQLSNTSNGMNYLYIRGETHTIGYLLMSYMTLADKSIEYVNYMEDTSDQLYVKLKWRHPSKLQIIDKAINLAIKDLEQLKK